MILRKIFCYKTMRLVRCTLTLVLTLCVLEARNVEPSNYPIATRLNQLFDSAETHHTVCGKEYSHNTSAEETNKTYFNAGEVESVRCDATGSTLNFEYQNYPERFMIYPQSRRVCLSNGRWSGPTPICVRTRDNYISTEIKVEPSCTVDCLSGNDCSLEWEQVGQLHKFCEDKKHSSIQGRGFLKRYEFVFTFNRPHYFSFVTLKKADVFDVALFAKKDGIISNLSDDATQLLYAHYDKWNQQKERNENGGKDECPIINIPTFTDQLKVSYSAYTDAAEISFYRIYKCFEKDEDGEEECERCPKEPVFPNATPRRIPDKASIEYTCNDGYEITDPVTNKLVNASVISIKCIEGVWLPYPFPSCKKVLGEKSAIEASDVTLPVTLILLFAVGFFAGIAIALFILYKFGKTFCTKKRHSDLSEPSFTSTGSYMSIR